MMPTTPTGWCTTFDDPGRNQTDVARGWSRIHAAPWRSAWRTPLLHNNESVPRYEEGQHGARREPARNDGQSGGRAPRSSGMRRGEEGVARISEPALRANVRRSRARPTLPGRDRVLPVRP